METFRLVRPEKQHEQAAKEYLQEFYASGSETHGVGGLEKYQDDYDGWLQNLEEMRNMQPGGRLVPSETFFLMRRDADGNDKLVGTISVRFILNDGLWQYGGNIGYGIRPSERRKGYNKINLYLALKVCQQHGLEVVLLDCDKDNTGSAKTMRALGGKLIREHLQENSQGGQVLVQDYVIDVDAAVAKNRAQYEPLLAESAVPLPHPAVQQSLHRCS